MKIGSVFENNLTQAVWLPVGTGFPVQVKRVGVRVDEPDRVLSPIGQAWDSFLPVDDDEDVHIERGDQGTEQQREPIE